jgi:hypothetical protein
VLLLATSIASSIWAIVSILRFEVTVATRAYHHLPASVGISWPCEHFIPFTRRRNPVLSHLADLITLLVPSGKSAVTVAYDTTISHDYYIQSWMLP